MLKYFQSLVTLSMTADRAGGNKTEQRIAVDEKKTLVLWASLIIV